MAVEETVALHNDAIERTVDEESNRRQAVIDHPPSAGRDRPSCAADDRVNIEFSYRVAGPSPRTAVPMNTNHH